MLKIEIQGAAALAVSEDKRPVAVLTRLYNSPFELGGEQFTVAREEISRFTLSRPFGIIAVGDRMTGDHVVVECPPHRFDLVRDRRRDWTIHQDSQPVGSCRVSMLSATADLPAALPIATRVFLFYIVFMVAKGDHVGWLSAWA